MNALGILLLTTQIKYIFGITTATYLVAIATFLIIYLSSIFIRFMPAYSYNCGDYSKLFS